MGSSPTRTLATLALALASLGAGPEPEPELRPVLGRLRYDLIDEKDTLLDVAWKHRLGYQAVIRLNPGLDPWIPEPGTVVHLPTKYVLPLADEEGLVINLPEMRLYDFTVEELPEVFALAVGDLADPSIVGDFRVRDKRENPVWSPPKSIRSERPGLPAQVPPGPDNPLGSRWMRVGHTAYGIHGTNVRWSIGRQATHGCLRLYEDEIQRLYARVPEGTRLQIVYQTAKWGRHGNHLYLEAHPDLYELVPDPLAAALELPRAHGLLHAIHEERVRQTVEEARGIPVLVGTLPEEPAPTSTPTSRRSRPRGAPRRLRAGRPRAPRRPRPWRCAPRR